MGDKMKDDQPPRAEPQRDFEEESICAKVRNELGRAGRFERVNEDGSGNGRRKEVNDRARKENEEKDIQVNQRQKYQCQQVRILGVGGNGELGPYDDEEHRRLGICADRWATGEMGHGI